jgi:glutamate/aspartate transport system substrate-binding protein
VYIKSETLTGILLEGIKLGKKFVDLVLSRAMVDGEVNTAYRRWFLNPIPPRGITLGIPVSPLLREQFTFPTDKVGDEVPPPNI